MSCSSRLKSKSSTERRVTTVLVVDTDDVQLDSICRGVFLYGHRCIKLSTMGEALDFLNSLDSPPIDILITDVSRGVNDGFELIRRARALHSGLPIIAVCGLAGCEELESLREGGVLILRRPFHPKGLDTVIRDSVA